MEYEMGEEEFYLRKVTVNLCHRFVVVVVVDVVVVNTV